MARWEEEEPELPDIVGCYRLEAFAIEDWEGDSLPPILIPVDTSQRAETAEMIALYFHRELQYDIQPFAVGDELTPQRRIYLIAMTPPLGVTLTPIAIGALEVLCVQEREVLMWCWLHPFARGRGYWATRVWPALLAFYPELLIQAPLSYEMRRFTERNDIAPERIVTVGPGGH